MLVPRSPCCGAPLPHREPDSGQCSPLPTGCARRPHWWRGCSEPTQPVVSSWGKGLLPAHPWSWYLPAPVAQPSLATVSPANVHWLQIPCQTLFCTSRTLSDGLMAVLQGRHLNPLSDKIGAVGRICNTSRLQLGSGGGGSPSWSALVWTLCSQPLRFRGRGHPQGVHRRLCAGECCRRLFLLTGGRDSCEPEGTAREEFCPIPPAAPPHQLLVFSELFHFLSLHTFRHGPQA